MIADALKIGKENTITGRELAALYGCNIRDITLQIEKERREGLPICAEMRGTGAGYYLASNEEELNNYCGILHHRAAQLYKTRQELLKVLKQYADGKSAQEIVTDSKERRKNGKK